MSNVKYHNVETIQNFKQISVHIEPEAGIVWVYQKPHPRPCFNPNLISEVRKIQKMLEQYSGKLPYNGKLVPINYHVLDSQTPGIFSMGGDLSLFKECIINKDKTRLLQYAKTCIDTIHSFIVGFRLPITTISLVRGDALGGGFEVALSSHVVIAEKGISLGFPEILFNLFPGMGGYHLLLQRLNPYMVQEMMLNGRVYSSEELFDMGVIDILAESGGGKNSVYSYVEKSTKYRNGFHAMQQVKQRVNPITYDELWNVCSYWVDIAMEISERDLRLMDRLIKAQNRKAATGYQESAMRDTG
ncbi:MAG: hypothetical protein A3I13_05660 [Gammaproteobacteria bacterium RIFCSPLOWO2_02_FULL_47_50]|jgi:DSF synthase|nr:MAG: hypothetical protein A2W69_02345 [Gammaproteobacteria bacterium RIFCSPLOWO2_02_47_7]OGT76015.1 MAG: hypothetical protein A2W76_01530 [Gammaproteobacteria bacterium RIFCSPLOWO2_12_47_11]OGT78851.1 MAG: hypothetical protein A3I13_05660 [Gammaproteobacteria bacterium RIFCSPLOWO2_02_FULL_47_50]